MSDKPALQGKLVLDLSRVLAGPWASQTLADLGATVIKIERPGKGDDTRGFGPPFFQNADGDDISAYFMSANRGKQSVCIDISQPQGADLVRQLAAKADIVIENFKVGDLAKRGLDYDTLAAINPRLIYCSITGFGQTGPYQHRPGYDFMIQGMTGLMSITGDPTDASGPQKVGVALADILTGLYSTIAILAAIEERNQSGIGQHIDMSLLDVVTACLANQASNYLVSDAVPERMGNAHPNIVPYQTFETQDAHIIIAVGNDSQFGQLCACLDLVQLSADSRFTTNADRVENREVLVPLLQAAFSVKSMDEWLHALEEAGVPCGPINTIDRVFEDAQFKARGIEMTMDGMPLVSNPIKYSRTPLDYRLAPPVLGKNTTEVLTDTLQLDAATIDALLQSKVIA
ncbi:MAG: CaiB/BaiF CoA-transferase family protein [Pseudomonadales bacterium]|nr:CaiB/BaiF CoA-transferase family protein [Pseudomonadales bacterium]